ncbi:MAG: transcriptional regulator [Deltaproteobacteria bacterium]|nr:MAG: transcriptional regulator [Deltaproteobacteria bacterium]
MLESLVSASDKGADCEVFTFDVARIQRARAALWAEPEIVAVTDLLKLAGGPARLRVLLALAVDELCVCDLAQVLGLSVSATSNQLQALRRAGLIGFRKSGKLAFYSLRRHELLDLVSQARAIAALGERG